MKVVVLIILAITLLLVQSSVLSPFGPWFPARPDLLLLLVITWGIAFGHAQGVVAAALCGFLMDMVSAMPLGGHILALVPVVLLSLVLERRLTASRFLFSMLLVLLATMVYYLALAVVLQLNGRHVDWIDSIVQVMVPGALTNVVVSPLFFWVTAVLAARFGGMSTGQVSSRPFSRAGL